MLVSAELRWFWKDTLPPDLESWFRAGAFAPGGGTTREDEYLFDPNEVELGVKKRGGQAGIEIKGLVAVGAARPPPFPGHVQIQCKWTSNTLTIDHLRRVVVRKTRWLRRYEAGGAGVRELRLDAQERVPGSSPDSVPEEGCHLELVAVAIGEREDRWWTLAFESFGPLGRVEQILDRTIAHLAPTQPPALDGARELSYPHWLSLVAGRA
jgi:hypothetical protein